MLMIAQVKPFVIFGGYRSFFFNLLHFLACFAGVPFLWFNVLPCVCETLQWHSFYCKGRMVFYIVVTGEPFGGFCEQIRHMYANSK